MSNPVSDFPEKPDVKKEDFAEEDEQHRFGWGKCTPRALQWCHRSACMLFWFCCMVTVQGMVINGFVGTSLPTLELRFGFSSKQSGIIAVLYDVFYMFACVPVTYYGARAHKGKLLGIGCILMSVGSVFFFLPHFVSGLYQYADNVRSSTACEPGKNTTRSPDCSSSEYRSSIPGVMGLFVIGQLLHGIGCTPMFTLAYVYIDENVSRRFSSLFIGIYSMFAAVGPGLGFILNGFFLTIYGDTGRVDPKSINLTPRDPRWYGAWWIGFVMSAVFALLMSFPILGYARQIPGSAYRLAKRTSESHLNSGDDVADRPEFGSHIRDLPRSMLLLLCNVPFMFLILSSAIDSFLLNGFINFFPKYFIVQFNLGVARASLLTGGVGIAGSVIGSLVGGGVITMFRLRARAIIWLGTASMFISAWPLLGVLLYCKTPNYAGVHTGYDPNVAFTGSVDLNSTCNSNCDCHSGIFQPVCSGPDTMYYSPCHAGCATFANNTFSNCACLQDTALPVFPSTSGQCQSSCGNNLNFGLVSCFLFVLFTFIAYMPNVQAILRVVSHNQRSLATGIGWVFGRLIGTIPGPIAIGAVIDHACLLWGDNCGQRTSCRIYNRAAMRRNFLILILCFRFVAVFLFLMAGITYKPPKDEAIEIEPKDKKDVKGMDNPSYAQ